MPPRRGGKKKGGPSPQQLCRAAFSKHCSGDSLPMASLHLVLGELGLEVSSANVVSVQGGLRALIPFEQNIRAPNLDNGVSYELFYKWYVLNTQSGHYKGNNALLVKRVIETTKLATRNLPSVAHVFGQKQEHKSESAHDVVMHWHTGERSKSKETGVSLLKINKGAVSEGKFSAKQLNQFLKDHREDKKMQQPRPVAGRGKGKKGGDERNDIVYNKSKNQEEKTNMDKILFHQVKGDMTESAYAFLGGQRRAGKLPHPVGTRSSMLLRQVNSQSEEKEEKLWKISKFEKVNSRVNSRR